MQCIIMKSTSWLISDDDKKEQLKAPFLIISLMGIVACNKLIDWLIYKQQLKQRQHRSSKLCRNLRVHITWNHESSYRKYISNCVSWAAKECILTQMGVHTWISYLLTDCCRAVGYRCVFVRERWNTSLYVRPTKRQDGRQAQRRTDVDRSVHYQFYFIHPPYSPVSARSPAADVLSNTKLAMHMPCNNVYTGHAWYTPFAAWSNSTGSTTHTDQSINQSAWTCYGAPHAKLWGARNTVKIQQHNSVTIMIQRRGESLV